VSSIIEQSPVIVHWNIPLWSRILIVILIFVIMYAILWWRDWKDEQMNLTKAELMRNDKL
jgi:hypothetical protein